MDDEVMMMASEMRYEWCWTVVGETASTLTHSLTCPVNIFTNDRISVLFPQPLGPMITTKAGGG